MKNLRHVPADELSTYLKEKQQLPYVAKQVQDWLWRKNVGSIEEMSNLSKALRQQLHQDFAINKISVHQQQISEDRTIKSAFKLYDGNIVEGVLIPTDNRMTACVSSQVGCSLTCKFCATGQMDRKRNLDFDEIYDQVYAIHTQALTHYNMPLSNIVYMGMGEPLLNYKNVLQSTEYINSEQGLGMSYSRITVSTAGIAKMIKQLGNDKVKFNLALSLHAANDEKRNEIMPINESNNLKTIIDALNYYYKATKNPLTFEYILFSNFNDAQQDADELIAICKRVPAKVNIIEYNPVANVSFMKPNEEQTDWFLDYLRANKVHASLRRSRGKDIDAACGQLANKN
jgi:23S rRNA (adenine2503-C2)-methyltransferase